MGFTSPASSMTKSQLDSESNTNAPPPYDAVSMQSKRSSVRSALSWMLRRDQNCANDLSCTDLPRTTDLPRATDLPRDTDPPRTTDLPRTTVLSTVRDLVATPDLTAASMAPIVNPFALSPAELSDHLQLLNVEGHTPIYWAIVNCRKEAISAYIALLSSFPISSACSSDLRLACMVTSNNAVFMQLKLGRTIGCKCVPTKKSITQCIVCHQATMNL
jgi:hypothetical protein